MATILWVGQDTWRLLILKTQPSAEARDASLPPWVVPRNIGALPFEPCVTPFGTCPVTPMAVHVHILPLIGALHGYGERVTHGGAVYTLKLGSQLGLCNGVYPRSLLGPITIPPSAPLHSVPRNPPLGRVGKRCAEESGATGSPDPQTLHALGDAGSGDPLHLGSTMTHASQQQGWVQLKGCTITRHC